MWIRCGFLLDQLITEIYLHQLECESTVNTPADLPKPEGHFLIWPKPVHAAKQCVVWP